jgi:hypothetical protein
VDVGRPADDKQVEVGLDRRGRMRHLHDVDMHVLAEPGRDRLRDVPGVAEHGLVDDQGAHRRSSVRVP